MRDPRFRAPAAGASGRAGRDGARLRCDRGPLRAPGKARHLPGRAAEGPPATAIRPHQVSARRVQASRGMPGAEERPPLARGRAVSVRPGGVCGAAACSGAAGDSPSAIPSRAWPRRLRDPFGQGKMRWVRLSNVGPPSLSSFLALLSPDHFSSPRGEREVVGSADPRCWGWCYFICPLIVEVTGGMAFDEFVHPTIGMRGSWAGGRADYSQGTWQAVGCGSPKQKTCKC